MKFYYTYLLKSLKTKRWYTGFTGNLKKRLNEHNRGYNFSTKLNKPFELIYYEACLNEEDAIAREKFLKSGPGKKYLKNRLKRFLLTGFGPSHRRPIEQLIQPMLSKAPRPGLGAL